MSDMTSFVCRFAGVNVEICTAVPEIQDFFRDYLSDGAPDFRVEITAEDREKQRVQAEEVALEELGYVPDFSDVDLELIAVHGKVSDGLAAFGSLLIHGSAIARDGMAYLFTAPSGTGKSTHSRLWRERFGDQVFMVNDDKPFVTVRDGCVTISGSPWDGKHHLSRNVTVPLKAICLLERGEVNQIERVSAHELLPALLHQVYLPEERESKRKAIGLLHTILQQVPLYRLRCNMEPEAADVSYEGMQ